MRNKQILALILAAAVTVPSQIATAADMSEQLSLSICRQTTQSQRSRQRQMTAS